MHEALLKLGLLRAKAAVRGLLRGARRPRGLLFLIIGGFVIGSWLCGSLVGVVAGQHRPTATPSWLPVVIPLFLLAYTVASLFQFRSGALIFTPAEIDFLFPGPFSRRELLLYKLLGKLLGCTASALFMSLAFLRHAPSFWGLYLGLVFTLAFVQLVQLATSLMGMLLAERVRRWGRLALLAVIAALFVAIVVQTPPLPAAADKIPEWWQAISNSLGGRILLAPFQVFAWAALPPQGYPAGFVWLGLAVAVDAGLLALVLLLDANYLESSLFASQKRYELMQRARQGRRVATIRPVKRQGRIRPFAWWGGAGPTAWRQLTTALRTGRIIWLLPPILFGAALLIGTYSSEIAIGLISVLLVYLTFILVAQVRYDFRGDLDNIPWLKSLPLSPLALSAGELIAPVVLTSAILLAAMAGLWGAVDFARLPLAAAAPFVPALMLLMYGVENVFFLLFPSRSLVVNFGELQSVGRFIVIFACKSLVLGATAGISLGCGGLGYLISGESLVVAGVVTWTTLVAMAVATLPAAAWAFSRFDPGVDIPA